MTVKISRPVISIKEARKLMKQDGAGLSDDEIKILVRNIESISDNIWSDIMVRKKGLVK